MGKMSLESSWGWPVSGEEKESEVLVDNSLGYPAPCVIVEKEKFTEAARADDRVAAFGEGSMPPASGPDDLDASLEDSDEVTDQDVQSWARRVDLVDALDRLGIKSILVEKDLILAAQAMEAGAVFIGNHGSSYVLAHREGDAV